MVLRKTIDCSDHHNNPLSEISHCDCGYIQGNFCARCGSPDINFPTGESFRVVGDEETAWRCVTWLASQKGNYQSTPFTNSRGTYRVVSEDGYIFREKKQPNGSWTPAGWYTTLA